MILFTFSVILQRKKKRHNNHTLPPSHLGEKYSHILSKTDGKVNWDWEGEKTKRSHIHYRAKVSPLVES